MCKTGNGIREVSHRYIRETKTVIFAADTEKPYR